MVRQRMRLNLRKVFVVISFLVIVGAITLVLLAREDLHEMLRALLNADYKFVLLALSAYTLSTILWSARWHTALSAIGHRVGLRDLYLVIYGSIFINNVTPLTRGGGDPIGRAYLLRKVKGVPYSHSLATITSEYILDVPVFLSFLALGLLAYLGMASFLPAFIVVGIWITAAILLIPLFSRVFGKRVAANRIINILIRVLKSLRRRASRVGITRNIESFYKGTHIVINRWKNALLIITFSAILGAFDMLRLFFIFKALGYDAPLVMLLLASTLPTIAGLVPLLPGGLGVVDATFISIFRLFFPLNIAIAATLIERAISYVFSTLVGAGVLSYLGIRVWAR